MVEIKEVLRLWRAGRRRSGSPPSSGWTRRPCAAISPPPRAAALARRCRRRSATSRSAPSSRRCAGGRAAARRRLGSGARPSAPRSSAARRRLRLTKIRRLLHRRASTSRTRRCTGSRSLELGFGQRATTIPVPDGEPGEELQIDTGWVTCSSPTSTDASPVSRVDLHAVRFALPLRLSRLRGDHRARHRGVRGRVGVLRRRLQRPHPRYTKAIVHTADPLKPRITPAFSSTRRRAASTSTPRACGIRRTKRASSAPFPASATTALPAKAARPRRCARRARHWCLDEYGAAPPHVDAAPAARALRGRGETASLPAPTAPYDIPLWSEPKVGRDQLAQVAKALYSMPHPVRSASGLRARADRTTVRFYDSARAS